MVSGAEIKDKDKHPVLKFLKILTLESDMRASQAINFEIKLIIYYIYSYAIRRCFYARNVNLSSK